MDGLLDESYDTLRSHRVPISVLTGSNKGNLYLIIGIIRNHYSKPIFLFKTMNIKSPLGLKGAQVMTYNCLFK